MKTLLTYILITILAIMFALMLAWVFGTLKEVKLPVIKTNLAPQYEIPYDNLNSKG